MSCGSCGTGSNGKPGGCQSNGGCSSGGCNRMNVFNWLADIPLSDIGKPFPIVEISFNNGSRKDFFNNDAGLYLEKGMMITVEGANGFDVGQVSLTGELVKLQMKKNGVKETEELKKVLRIADEFDMDAYQHSKAREKDILIQSRAIAKSLNLEMKIAEAELQADGRKVCFFYTADSRVDFRELIKVYAGEFKTKIEMRQIGARQESSKIGGIGSCGRELCCSSWLSDFKTVNTTTARYQNLSINQAKLSGQCGRLKCCLNFELDTYIDALKVFPEQADHLEISTGRAYLIKKDIFRNLIWYGIPGSSRQYPVSIERVEEILAMNARGEKPTELETVEVETKNKNAVKTVDMGFINDVGQINLSSLNKTKKKDKDSHKEQRNDNRKPEAKKQKPQQHVKSKEQQKESVKAQDKPKQAHPNQASTPTHAKPNKPKFDRDAKSKEERAPREPKAHKTEGHQTPQETREPREPREQRGPREGRPNRNVEGKPQHEQQAGKQQQPRSNDAKPQGSNKPPQKKYKKPKPNPNQGGGEQNKTQ